MTGEKYVDGIRTRYFKKGSGALVVCFMVVILALTVLWNCAEDWRSNFDGLTERFHVFAATNREPSDFRKKSITWI
jgi:hypothetical protein